jgi:peroxiredoxin
MAEVGETLAPMRLPRVGGGSVRVAQGPTLLFFFRAEEGACTAAAAAVERIAEALAPSGLLVIGVSQDGEGEAAEFATQHGMSAIDLCHDAPSLLASSAAGVGQVPTVLLLDAGTVAARVTGWSRRDYNALAARAAQLVGAEAPVASRPGDGLPESL